MMPRPPRLTPVFLESPYAGDVEANVAYLRACMRDCLRRGEAPFASHGLYTQPGVLRDDDPDERELGIRAGFAWRPCAERTVVYTDRGVSAGMERGIDDARDLVWQEIEYRTLGLDVPIAAVAPGELAEVHAQLTERETLRARLAAATDAVRAAGLLFERAACDDHRHPPDDHVALETWELICKWQARPEVLEAMTVVGNPAAPSCDGTDACQCPLCWGQPAMPDKVEQTWFSIGGARVSLGSIKAALSLAGMVVHQFEDCPACGPGPCTPACPEREWRYRPAAPAEKRAAFDSARQAEIDDAWREANLNE